jgi:AbrB family looped-hinge helix DNA binding protein
MGSLITRISSKGQVVLPKAVRDENRGPAGTRLVVENTKEGVLLKPAPLFPPTTLDQVAGRLAYKGPAKTIEEMDDAVLAEALIQNPDLRRKPIK